MSRSTLALVLALAATWASSCPLLAEDTEGDLPAGHSAHGQAFSEGPRQAAYKMPGCGEIVFPITTKVPDAAEFVRQGIGQQHGFWYLEAERSFRQAASLDPDCAIAYWGMALANRANEARGKAFMAEAVKRRDKAGAHEQLYIDALAAYYEAGPGDEKARREAFAEALKKIIEAYPEDLEARAFLALEYWQSRRYGLKSDKEDVDKIIEHVLAAAPNHPIHHYKIHLWDGKTAARALESAARCGQSAPGIAHMWHMPGHIYSALARYSDAAWQQEASARTDHRYLMRDRVLPDQIFNYAHNNEWLVRNLMIIGRVRDAMDLAQNMIQLPRHPKYNHFARRNSSSSYGRRRLFEVLEYYEMWDELLELTDGTYLEPTDDVTEQVRRHRARALAFVMKRKFRQAKLEVKDIWKKRPQVIDAMEKAGDKAEAKAREEGRSGTEIGKARSEAQKRYQNVLRMTDSVKYEMQCYLLLLVRRDANKAIAEIDKATLMPRERKARFYLAAGKFDKAKSLIEKEVKSRPKRVQPLANQVDILFRAKDHAGAKAAFAELIEHSADIDSLDTPAFKRLARIARAYRLPRDWRKKPEVAADIGERPDLDTLGPFRWTSYMAPEWSLPDGNAKTITLDGFRRKKPVIVIFYLGDGCAHCVEQLAAFKPATEKFAKMGVKLIAISTDDVPALAASMGTRGYPFKLVSNAKLDVFKQYRCYDDFEKMPLHGTFLIDKTGRVRWQDISYEPFTEVDFLLDETRRLLGQKLSPKKGDLK